MNSRIEKTNAKIPKWIETPEGKKFGFKVDLISITMGRETGKICQKIRGLSARTESCPFGNEISRVIVSLISSILCWAYRANRRYLHFSFADNSEPKPKFCVWSCTRRCFAANVNFRQLVLKCFFVVQFILAFTVRALTRRFIGEYDTTLGKLI